MTINQFYKRVRGFTIVEVMVAMVVLAIGLLGMAGMTIMVIKGGTDASRMTFATNLTSDKMESFKNLTWATLGSGATCTASTLAYPTNPLADGQTNGCASQGIMVEQGLNQQGLKTGDTGANPPYPFIRKYVVCNGPATATPPSPPLPPTTCNRCLLGSGDVPPELMCNPASLPGSISACSGGFSANTSEVAFNEKKIKILVGWLDKSGRCHFVNMTGVQVNLQ